MKSVQEQTSNFHNLTTVIRCKERIPLGFIKSSNLPASKVGSSVRATPLLDATTGPIDCEQKRDKERKSDNVRRREREIERDGDSNRERQRDAKRERVRERRRRRRRRKRADKENVS